MRTDFAALLSAGIQRCRFSAFFQGATRRRGYLAFRNVTPPVGFADHAYIRQEHWLGDLPREGDRIEFLASIDPYRKDSGEVDYRLIEAVRA